jgi:putative endonuclease
MWLRGYRVVGRNVRVAGREVDLVARRGGTLVVCEVKARRTGARGSAVEAVAPAQRRRLRQAAEVLLARDPSAARVRLDLIAVDGWRVRVLRDAL